MILPESRILYHFSMTKLALVAPTMTCVQLVAVAPPLTYNYFLLYFFYLAKKKTLILKKTNKTLKTRP